MPRQARVKSRSGVYHVMLRGANKQEIFHDDEDCIRFLDTIERYKIKSQMQVFAWCLMNNHVHLLLKEGNEDISITMKRIGVSFVSYYNQKYNTVGHLFQDRFRSENVESRRYLLTVVRYIHQNPVKAGIVNKVDAWRWSSCPTYYSESPVSDRLLDRAFVLSLFSTNLKVAMAEFKVFNEKKNDDDCLDDKVNERRRLTDEEARLEIIQLLGGLDIAQVKALPRLNRNNVLRKVKAVEGISNRQAARILGVSPNLIFKA
ncbi:REP-associated tyrosine transposase [Oceanobacillus bengalensis]|uniref:Transposase n=1 Tax=Oceanobacillus bengalensis TaxID=1435466 RepID=A0A494YTT9_9BACI|nr:transposase [Oceanobacillus bengalensis]RKQ13532.1 transposase [Oceanobacillus bengalensis]